MVLVWSHMVVPLLVSVLGTLFSYWLNNRRRK
ncbi:type I toxin-antitoxin system Fst family toxin [Pediococcus acidilactici]|nr:type I toxin-antitoxin system Fst family toxin [Pediococcus acidilactici]